MANKYGTLTELFAAIANKIRQADGTTAKIVADDFPERIAAFTGTVLNEKFNLTVPGVSAVELPTDFTPKCFYYHGGYWWVGGNDSAGCGYVAYSADFSNWTVVKIHNSRAHPVHALGFDLDNGYVFVFGDTSGYSGRSVLRINNIFEYNTENYNYNYWTHNVSCTDAVTIDGLSWAVTGSKTTVYTTANDSCSISNHTSILHDYFRCCVYNNYPVAISDDGYYTFKNSAASLTVSGETQIAADFAPAVCKQMGEYLVISGTKSDGTYLYYAKGTPGSLTFTGRRITSKVVTPIGLAYANGLYIMAYMDGSNLRFWAAESLENNNSLFGIKIAEVYGTIGIAMAASGNVAGLLVNNGDKANVAAYTVP